MNVINYCSFYGEYIYIVTTSNKNKYDWSHRKYQNKSDWSDIKDILKDTKYLLASCQVTGDKYKSLLTKEQENNSVIGYTIEVS